MFMNDVYQEDKQLPFTPIDANKMVAIILLGAVVGLIVWGLSIVLDTYVLSAILCKGTETLRCAGTSQYAEAAATIIGAGVGLFFLVRLQVFRPLLVVLAATISLWGIVGLADLLPWYGIGISAVLLYALAYGVFTWVARLRSFWLVLVLLIALIAGVRLVLSLQ
jgi:hypothetical protein